VDFNLIVQATPLRTLRLAVTEVYCVSIGVCFCPYFRPIFGGTSARTFSSNTILNIYIDEAGTFIPTDRDNYVSCVAAVIVPSHRERYLFDGYLQLRTSWGSPKSEIKGSKMDERQVAHVLKLLSKYSVLVEISAICTSGVEEEGITELKLKQALGITEHLTSQHHPTVVAGLEAMRDRATASSNQLYLQSFAMTRVLKSVLPTAIGFWAQRYPAKTVSGLSRDFVSF
jgi:hypothetical protein